MNQQLTRNTEENDVVEYPFIQNLKNYNVTMTSLIDSWRKSSAGWKIARFGLMQDYTH